MDFFRGSKVLFSPCGIGLGHVSRSVTIAEKLIDYGSNVLFSTYLEGIDYVQRHNLPVIEVPDISLVNDPTGRIDLKATSISTGIYAFPTFMQQVSAEIKIMKSFKPDLVFSDTRLSSIYAAKLLHLPVVLLINQFLPRIPRNNDRYVYRFLDGVILTILGSSWALSDVIIIPDFPEPYTISVESLRIPNNYLERVLFVGSVLSKKPEDVDGSTIRKNLSLSEDAILIYAGISGPKPERLPLIRKLEPILKELSQDFKVVMSMGNPEGGNEPVLDGNFVKIPWIENRFEFLKASDIMISRSGHETIMQSVSYGKPSILIPVPNHPEQYGNARRAKKLGIAEPMHQNDVDKDSILKVIKKIENGNHGKKARSLTQSIPTGDGLQLTINALKDILASTLEI
jgi:uncharacterized protein (TIGR00661 family)